ncbi:MAG TPA: cyclic nucleotide-binding domain-containing protein [Thermoflexia bacterium]|nr:cyclic nucleotide-binding domain-containing protein [Thermoflexia bacterium]
MVPRHEIVERLRNVRLFSNLSLFDLEALAALVRPIEYTRGAIVYRQGEPGDRYFIVHRGCLRATRLDPEGEMVEVRRLEPGDGVGETSLLLGDVRDVTLEVLERSILLYIERAAFEQFLREHPRAERALKMRPDIAERRRYPHFHWMEADEFPVKVIRKHPALLVINLIPSFLLLIISSAGLIFTVLQVGEGPLLYPLLLIFALLGSAAFWAGFVRYVDWWNDLYVVTNRRVAHRERTGFLGMGGENISAAPLSAVQDVNITRVGALASIFDFGDLVVETAGGGGEVRFFSIPRPSEIQGAILKQQARALALARLQQREQIRKTVHHYFAEEAERPPQEQSPEEEEEKPAGTRQRGCLTLPISVVRYFFPPLWERDKEVVTWHKHWIELLRTAGPPLLGLIAAAVLFLSGLLIGGNWFWMALLSSILIFLVTFPWFFWKFEDWRNDYYQVTASRIIHVERKPFYIRHERREASLEAVTNVRAEKTFWGRLLRYGDVIVETRAPGGAFYFRAVSHPEAVQQEIFAHVAAFNRRRREQEAERRRTEMVDWLIAYDELRRSRSQPPQEGE